jgi:histidinol-phosphatase (PHP family)
VVLPADNHVHSEWSWDALAFGSMDGSCARAVELGLPAIAFTEHADWTPWTVRPEEMFPAIVPHQQPDGTIVPPPLRLDGYLESLDRCRRKYPDLRIVSGVELGEPHLHGAAVSELLTAGGFERVLGSLHCIQARGGRTEPAWLFKEQPPADVLRQYLAEIATLIEESDAFGVLAHIDYALREWAGPYDPADFEAEFRHALEVLAASDRAMEINTSGVLRPELVRWWAESGGRAVSFGGDSHRPAELGRGLAAAVDLAEAHGFRAGRDHRDFWYR